MSVQHEAYLATVTEMYSAVKDMLEHGPCSDPDCTARARLAAALEQVDAAGSVVMMIEEFTQGKVEES